MERFTVAVDAETLAGLLSRAKDDPERLAKWCNLAVDWARMAEQEIVQLNNRLKLLEAQHGQVDIREGKSQDPPEGDRIG